MSAKLKFDSKAKAEFLQEIEEHGIKAKACRAVGIAYSTLKTHLDKDPEFAKQFELAMEVSGDGYEEEARRRAMDGVEEDIFDRFGKVIGTKTRYSDRFLDKMLTAAKPDKYGEKKKVEVTGTIHHEHMLTAKHNIMKKLEKAVGTTIDHVPSTPETLPISRQDG